MSRGERAVCASCKRIPPQGCLAGKQLLPVPLAQQEGKLIHNCYGFLTGPVDISLLLTLNYTGMVFPVHLHFWRNVLYIDI